VGERQHLGDPPPQLLEVVVRRGGEALRRAEFRPAGARQVSHRVQLPDGEYLLELRLTGPGGARSLERPFSVSESGTVVVPVE
jgi:hypothetical protein